MRHPLPAIRLHGSPESQRKLRNALFQARREPGAGHSPGFADSGVAARQGNGNEAREAREPVKSPDEQLPTPDRPVRSEPGAVVDRAHRRPPLAVLGQARGQVRVVMLDSDQPRLVTFARVRGGEVVRVKIVGDEPRLDIEHALEARDPLAERDQCLVGAKVADVLADEGPSPRRHAEGALQFRADGHKGRRWDRQPERLGRVPA